MISQMEAAGCPRTRGIAWMGIGVSSHEELRCAHFVTGGAGRSAMTAGMPSPAFHCGL